RKPCHAFDAGWRSVAWRNASKKFKIDRGPSVPIQIGTELAPKHPGTPITFQRGLNLNVNPEGPTYGGMASSAPFTVETSKKWLREAEQFGAVAPSQLRNRQAPALPRSNQTDATLFDKGRTTQTGNIHEETLARRCRCYRVRGTCCGGGLACAHLCQGSRLYAAASGLQLDRLLYRRPP